MKFREYSRESSNEKPKLIGNKLESRYCRNTLRRVDLSITTQLFFVLSYDLINTFLPWLKMINIFHSIKFTSQIRLITSLVGRSNSTKLRPTTNRYFSKLQIKSHTLLCCIHVRWRLHERELLGGHGPAVRQAPGTGWSGDARAQSRQASRPTRSRPPPHTAASLPRWSTSIRKWQSKLIR